MSLRFLIVALLALAACRAPDPITEGRPPVWRVVEGETTVYLFGSAHALTPAAQWESPALDEALADAELVLFEIAPGAAQNPQTRALFEALGRNPPGVRLSSLLSAEDSARLRRVAQQLSLPLETLETLRPWAAAQQIALAGALAQGVRPDLGVEAILAQRLDGRPASGIETPDQQLALLAGLELERQLRLLSLALQQAEEDPGGVLEAELAWASGDGEAIAALSREGFEEVDRAFYEAMIVERNVEFADAALARLTGADEDVLIVVGAAHLSGEDGVPAMLRARGYTVLGP